MHRSPVQPVFPWSGTCTETVGCGQYELRKVRTQEVYKRLNIKYNTLAGLPIILLSYRLDQNIFGAFLLKSNLREEVSIAFYNFWKQSTHVLFQFFMNYCRECVWLTIAKLHVKKIHTDSASSRRKMASLTRRLMKDKNSGGFVSSMCSSAYTDNLCKKQNYW